LRTLDPRGGVAAELLGLGYSGPRQAAAIGTLIAPLAAAGSELATHQWPAYA